MAEDRIPKFSEKKTSSHLPPWKSPSVRPSCGLAVHRHFSKPNVHPFDEIEWETREAKISDETGKSIFEQKNVEIPASWSQLATKVVVSKYFYGDADSGERETSVKQLIHRVSRTIADRGRRDGYFATDEDAENFYDELTWLCVNQFGSFNSPVWFNVGLHDVYGITGSPAQLPLGPEAEQGRPLHQQLRIPAGLGLFHPVGRRHDGRHHASGPQRSDAL